MGLHSSLCLSSSTVPGSDSSSELFAHVYEGESSSGGDRVLNFERSSRASSTISRVLQPALRHSEGLGCVVACDRLVFSQRVGPTDSISDGIKSVLPAVCQEVRLDGFSRPQRCIPSSSYSSRQLQISSLCSGWQDISVLGFMLRPLHGPSGVYKGRGSSVSHASQPGNQNAAIFSRLAGSRLNSSGGVAGEGCCAPVVFTTGNCKPREVMSHTFSNSNLLGNGSGQPFFEGFSDREASLCHSRTDRRVSILQAAKHAYLEVSSRSSNIFMSSGSRGESLDVIPSTSASGTLGFCGRGGHGALDADHSVRPQVVVQRSSSVGRGCLFWCPNRIFCCGPTPRIRVGGLICSTISFWAFGRRRRKISLSTWVSSIFIIS